MGYKNFKLNCVLRVLILGATLFLLAWCLQNVDIYAVSLVLGLLAIYEIQALIRYIEKTNRDLTRFLNAIKYEDYSQSFNAGGMGKSHESLSRAFSAVADEIRRARSEKEEQYRYLQTVVQHIGIGVISFQPDGAVELINTAAKKIFHLHQLKNINSLESFSPNLVNTLLKMEAGSRELISVDDADNPLSLAMYATQFRMRSQSYTLVSLQNIRSEIERERMTRELEIAHQVQMKLLPKESPVYDGYDIAGFCIPAKEVGGDYFDFIDFGADKLGLVVGDVSGKGVPAAIYMTLTKGVIQAHAKENISPRDVLEKVNALIYQSIEQKSFVTLFYAVLHPVEKRLICARAGHNPALHYSRSRDTFRWIQPEGIGLGLEQGAMFANVIREEELALESGDLFFLYTDGITEAMNHHDEYGEERLLKALRAHLDKPAQALIDAVYRDIQTFTGDHPRNDDMTMVAIKVK